jgi:CRP/FNR family cyclic AMP-dependent transcriptional regulator
MPETDEPQKQPVNAFWGNIFKRFRPHREIANEDVLRQCPLFCHLTKREMKKLSSLIYERHYQAGEYLFEKEQPGTAMFIIKSGLVKIVVPGRGDEESELAAILPEDFVGELALLDDTPRSASARAAEKTDALAFFREDLHELLDTYPVIASKILMALAIITGHRLKASNAQLMGRGD